MSQSPIKVLAFVQRVCRDRSLVVFSACIIKTTLSATLNVRDNSLTVCVSACACTTLSGSLISLRLVCD